MLFSGKENVFICLVAFQKMFRKKISNIWLCSWKYHRKHIFYLLLTFSQLPNDYIISFIPQNTNKTQKKNHKIRTNEGEITIREIAITIGEIAIGEIAIMIGVVSTSRDRDRDRRVRDHDRRVRAKIEEEIAIGATTQAGDVGSAMRRSRSRKDRRITRRSKRRSRLALLRQPVMSTDGDVAIDSFFLPLSLSLLFSKVGSTLKWK